jgi:hypothetical protein
MRYSIFWGVMQRVLVLSHRRFGTTHRSHLQGSIILSSWTTWSMKMGLTAFPETSVTHHQPTLHNIPEQWRCHLQTLRSIMVPSSWRRRSPRRSIETSVTSRYLHSKRRRISEYLNLKKHRCDNLKSRSNKDRFMWSFMWFVRTSQSWSINIYRNRKLLCKNTEHILHPHYSFPTELSTETVAD